MPLPISKDTDISEGTVKPADRSLMGGKNDLFGGNS